MLVLHTSLHRIKLIATLMLMVMVSGATGVGCAIGGGVGDRVPIMWVFIHSFVHTTVHKMPPLLVLMVMMVSSTIGGFWRWCQWYCYAGGVCGRVVVVIAIVPAFVADASVVSIGCRR